jgi:hypothetical protein
MHRLSSSPPKGESRISMVSMPAPAYSAGRSMSRWPTTMVEMVSTARVDLVSSAKRVRSASSMLRCAFRSLVT